MEQDNQQQQPPVFTQQEQGQQYGQPYSPYPKERPMLEFVEANKMFWRKGLTFKGRARRSEYWWGYLTYYIISAAWSALAVAIAFAVNFQHLDEMMADDMTLMSRLLPTVLIACIPLIGVIVPLYAAQTRRLHDVGRSGWWIILSMIPLLPYVASLCFLFSAILHEDDTMLPVTVLTMLVSAGVTFILSLIVLVFTLQDSKPEENEYGPSPKYYY